MLRALPLCRAIEEYVRWCLARESPPRVQELAACLGRSRGWLVAQLVAATGQPPAKCLKREQVRLAQRLLTTTALPVARIAYQAGFGTRRTLYRAFRAEAGVTPMGYRRRIEAVLLAGSSQEPTPGIRSVKEPEPAEKERAKREEP